jgi:hypothetical protein
MLDRRQLELNPEALRTQSIQEWPRFIRRVLKYVERGFTLNERQHKILLCLLAERCQLNAGWAWSLVQPAAWQVAADIVHTLEQLAPTLVSVDASNPHSFVIQHPGDSNLSFRVFSPAPEVLVVDSMPKKCHDLVMLEEQDVGVDHITVSIPSANIVTCYENERHILSNTIFYPCLRMQTPDGRWVGHQLQDEGIDDWTGQPRLITINTHDSENTYTVPFDILLGAVRRYSDIQILLPEIASYPFTASRDVVAGVPGSYVSGNHCQMGTNKLVYGIGVLVSSAEAGVDTDVDSSSTSSS